MIIKVISYKAFDILVDGVDRIGDSVLFYKVSSERILDLHKRLVEAVSPTDAEIKSGFELDHYIPHLTIMKHKKGYKDLPLNQIALESSKILNDQYLFKAHSVRFYGRHNEGKNYERIIDMPLS
ncbi:2'-5' RNA ligase family protein [Bacillus sp. FSL K6-3431]|uniref:2'-5' RNA ligase family protein n=1 Tax=Bacillus sp. FSL K6-3431 TaxID=2921500 RepID=UPI0030F549F6